MGLDLELLAISNKGNFIIEKAKQNLNYAADLHNICRTDALKHHLKMVQANPSEKDFEASLMELIKDSELITGFYPDKTTQIYRFYSRTRGYATLDYLLQHYLFDRSDLKQNQTDHIFYGGLDIDYAKQWAQFRYFDTIQTAVICDLLSEIDFDSLLINYDFNKMSDAGVYKLSGPEGLEDLRAEYRELQQFYKNAKNLDAFVLTRIS